MFGLILEPFNTYTHFVRHSFQLTMASLDISLSKDDPVQVMVKFCDTQNDYILCTLDKRTYQIPLNLTFEKTAVLTFSLKGEGVVHLTGNLVQNCAETMQKIQPDNVVTFGTHLNRRGDSLAKITEYIRKSNTLRNQMGTSGLWVIKVGDEEDEMESIPGDRKRKINSKDKPTKELKSTTLDDLDNINMFCDESSSDESEEDADDDDDDSNAKQQNKKDKKGYLRLPKGLKVKVMKRGTGEVVELGKWIHIYYHVSIQIGTILREIDQNEEEDGFRFKVGSDVALGGINAGVIGMKVGEKRRLIIPPRLGYGAAGFKPDIPPYTTLVYDIELLSVE